MKIAHNFKFESFRAYQTPERMRCDDSAKVIAHTYAKIEVSIHHIFENTEPKSL